MENPIIQIIIALLVFAGFVILIIYLIRKNSSDWRLSDLWTPKGEVGERRVSNILSALPQNEYRVLNDITIRNYKGTTQIDHIVVSIYGVFVIETKYYKGWIFGTQDSQYWTQNLYGYKYKLFNPILQNNTHILSLKKVVPELEYVPIFSIVAFSHQARLDNRIPGNYVIFWHELFNTISSRTVVSMTPEQMNFLCDKIQSARLDPATVKSKHITNVAISKLQNEMKIESGHCPRCGAPLILRNGKYGKFYGCSNYPKCRFTKDLE